MNARHTFSLLKEAGKEFSEDKAPRLAAALAYYTLFSLAPLLVIAIAVAGIVWGETAARDELMNAVRQVLGEKGAAGIQTMLASSQKGNTGIIATVVGLFTLLLGASGVFGQLKDALNTIWEVKPEKGGGIMKMVKQRFLSFTMVLGVGFLLLVSLVISAGLAAFGRFMERVLPLGASVWQILNAAVSLAVITLLFALLFKYLPDVKVSWRDVWVGAAFTSLLFVIGKFAIGFYLGKSAISSTFGAAASLAIILVWLYYSGLIFFFGAEFTEVHARAKEAERTGATVLPPRNRSAAGREERPEPEPEPAPRPTPQLQPVVRSAEPRPVRKTSKAAIAATGFAGATIGALAGSVGLVFVLAKATRKMLRF